ncbi:phosphatidylinositol phospholipase c [Grosmannia clavigera kw1407]|uniref:Phosphatidylinositol phospholipase c n=1 Tax=Grosmannia clavigera (strain kw1407 / UAMH 11150) TaxID=655863 RepID=F0XDR5_GROCL|nr:phosphatidylinositol phospholipase c [Grosmannia clavigera kw1407]EFX04737.1 phosphatidylinositol phospholipase c [Grosmannia clavigera kw1407]
MASLTIRNLSTTPLELTLVERFEASSARTSGRGAVWGLLRLSSSLVGSGGGGRCVPLATMRSMHGSGHNGLLPRTGEPPFARDEVTGVRVAPFASQLTYIRAADPEREVLRLTFAAEIARKRPSTQQLETVIRRYTVDIPAASPRSIELRPLDAEQDGPRPDDPGSIDAAATPAFTAVYSVHGAHLAVMSSAALGSWMATVDGTWPLSSLSLPGTHNSPACYMAMPSVRCQAVDVPTQLANGVRFVDVRVNATAHAHPHADPRMALVHGAFAVSVAGPTWFANLYGSVCAFLEAHPTETVLMSIKREGSGRGTDADVARNLLGCYVQPRPDRWYTRPQIPTLDEARGRIVLVRRFCLPLDDAAFRQPDGRVGWGIDGSDWPDNCAHGIAAEGRLHLQDYYGVNVASSIQRKIEYARAHFERAASQHFPASKTIAGAAAAAAVTTTAAAAACPPIFLNFLSGSNFFNKSCWPERIAARVNPAAIEYLCMRHGVAAQGPANLDVGDGSTGIVVTDWVGLDGDWDLVRCIVAWNARLQLKQQ